MQKTKDFCVDENGWIHCPFCKCRTRTKIRADTSLKNFPIFCPKYKIFLTFVLELDLSLMDFMKNVLKPTKKFLW